jgi:hypothetical protein
MESWEWSLGQALYLYHSQICAFLILLFDTFYGEPERGEVVITAKLLEISKGIVKISVHPFNSFHFSFALASLLL